ncbi:hypothetical protein DO72_5171 [Burkholderia pseudomallei]|nr:hypothetical protein DO72_5171 [Burkholderia pseudomallei]
MAAVFRPPRLWHAVHGVPLSPELRPWPSKARPRSLWQIPDGMCDGIAAEVAFRCPLSLTFERKHRLILR